MSIIIAKTACRQAVFFIYLKKTEIKGGSGVSNIMKMLYLLIF